MSPPRESDPRKLVPLLLAAAIVLTAVVLGLLIAWGMRLQPGNEEARSPAEDVRIVIDFPESAPRG